MSDYGEGEEVDERDIVERLRDYDNCTDDDVDRAADYIEALRYRIRELQRRMKNEPDKGD